MDWTDRHCRHFHRLISQYTWLYTEMVTTGAPVSALREHVQRGGARPLPQLGADMVLRHETTAEEIKRVVGW